MPRVSSKVASFTESVIREMTRLALEHDAINLSQGFPDFPCPPELKEAAKAAIDADVNQYAITWGAKRFRDAIAAKVERTYPGWAVDPERELTVTCGATEGVVASCLALLDPGDEVVVFEPWYENYWPDTVISGAVPKFVTLHEPDWHVDEEELRAAFGPPHPRDHRQHAQQPHRQGLRPAGAGPDRRALPALGRLPDHRRDL